MQVLAFDIEANGLNEVTINKKGKCIPEATQVWCAATCDVETGETRSYTQDQLEEFVQALEAADLIVGHNVFGYDIPVIKRLIRGFVPKAVYDTLVVSRMIWPDKPMLPGQSHSLKAWGQLLGEYKDDYQGGFDEYNEEMLTYCVQDTVVTAEVYKYQSDFVSKNKKAIDMEHKVADIISQQVENGFGFDLNTAIELEKQLMMDKAGVEDEMRRIFPDKIEERWSDKTGTVFNPGSRQQIAERLHDKYGWKAPTTDKGNPKVDRSVLAKLDYPEAQTLVKYFDETKLMSQVSDWIQRASCSRDKRIHGGINTLGTVTGRMTSSNPNMQQVSSDKRARSLFVPRKGWVIVGADLSGLELRMLAHYLGRYDNGSYSKQILEGDIHTHNQNAMGLDTRNKAKSAIYCFLYGGGDAKFGSVVGVSATKARQVKNQLLTNIPGLKRILQDVEFDAHAKGSIRPFDWREIPVRSAHAALNTLLQSSGAHIAKVWTCFCDKQLNKMFKDQWRWIANVHDELQIECSPDIAHELGREVCRCAEEAGKFLGCSIKTEAEYRVGKNWSETH